MHPIKRTIVYRANVRGQARLPLRVRSAGRYIVSPAWDGERPKPKWFAELFWTVEGRGEFLLDGKTQAVKAGDIFIYRPGHAHILRAQSPVWEYCWLTLDHSEVGEWLDGFGLDKPRTSPGPCPTGLFMQLISALKECTPQGERRAAHLAHAILLAASSRTGEPEAGSIAERARRLLDVHCHDPAWSVSDAVGELKIHRTTLLRAFQKDYGMTPSRYLQNRRIQKALSLLRDNDLQIQEVAWRAGFSDPNYFARAVHAATGMSPREFRRQ